MTTRNPNRLSVALEPTSADASAAPVAPSAFRLFRAGANETHKGVFLFNDRAAASVLDAAKRWGVRLSIDYNHGMLDGWPVDPSAAGKSAGSFVLDVRAGELWATDVKWTPAAKLAVESREWLYISPAFYNDDDGTIIELINVALTNIPATHNLDPLIALAALRESDNRKANAPMTFKGTLSLLSLPDAATDGDACAAITARLAPITELCALTGKATASEALGIVRAGVAALAALPLANAELSKVRAERLAASIEDAIKLGKVAPAQRDALIAWGTTNPDALASFLSVAVPVVAMDATGKQPAANAPAPLTDAEQAVCTQLGIKPADFIANRPAVG